MGDRVNWSLNTKLLMEVLSTDDVMIPDLLTPPSGVKLATDKDYVAWQPSTVCSLLTPPLACDPNDGIRSACKWARVVEPVLAMGLILSIPYNLAGRYLPDDLL